MLVDTNQRETSTTLFGHKIPAPICFAPIGISEIYHPQGELPVAKIASELGLPYCLSTAGSRGIEDVAKASGGQDKLTGRVEGGGVRFFQLYMPHDDELTLSLLNRAWVCLFLGLQVDVLITSLLNRIRDTMCLS